MSVVEQVKQFGRSARYLGYEAIFGARQAAGLARIAPPQVTQAKPERIRRVLMCTNRYEYGRPEWGDSYEHINWLPALRDIAQVESFDARGYAAKNGRAAMSAHLEELAGRGEYDLMLFGLMNDEFGYAALRRISQKSPTLTLNWFSDDQWRFSSFSNHWAGAFNFITTTDRSAPARYAALGYPHAIRTQWGVYAPRFEPQGGWGSDIPVAFVGQAHGGRRAMMARLRTAGLDVRCFGGGWEGGRLTHERMVETFANAGINLSPCESSIPGAPAQMKARFFEVAAAGGFQLAGHVDELGDYFEPDREIVTYRGEAELLARAREYLQDEKGRRRIARAGQKRCLEAHTYQKRFSDIFAQVQNAVRNGA